VLKSHIYILQILQFGIFIIECFFDFLIFKLQPHQFQLQIVLAILQGQSLVKLLLVELRLFAILLLQLLISLLIHLGLHDLFSVVYTFLTKAMELLLNCIVHSWSGLGFEICLGCYVSAFAFGLPIIFVVFAVLVQRKLVLGFGLIDFRIVSTAMRGEIEIVFPLLCRDISNEGAFSIVRYILNELIVGYLVNLYLAESLAINTFGERDDQSFSFRAD